MKISVRWLFDHIRGDWKNLSLETLVRQFNAKVAEIEHAEAVKQDLSQFTLGTVKACTPSSVAILLPQEKKSITLPARSDIPRTPEKSVGFLIVREKESYRWAQLKDVGMDKDGLMVPLRVTPRLLSGGWRTAWEAEDFILEVDNKSITHRPDMWGYRGFAREVAALFGLSLKKTEQFLANIPVQKTKKNTGYSLQNEAPQVCSALAGLHVPTIVLTPSDIRMVSRFVKVGYRPINAIVDTTNYVMSDWGHPMHAYDADRVADTTLVVRMARKGEKLTLLDSGMLQLTSADIVISDRKKVLGLAGIMGGKDDSVGNETKSLLLEAACFDAAHIRRSSFRHKVRTESSQRFEKTLDPSRASEALQRFITVARSIGVSLTCAPGLQLIGGIRKTYRIEMSHSMLQDRLGTEISSKQVKKILQALAFEVVLKKQKGSVIYRVTVPSFRATKDVTIAEDIVEEVARFYGFDAIPTALPALPKRADAMEVVCRKRRIKEFLAYGARMREVYNYAFYDEDMLSLLGWIEQGKLALKNPVSQTARRLVTSLLPHLLKNIKENSADHESLAFFEWAKIWGQAAESEQDALAGVWYEKRRPLSFYECKTEVMQVCSLVGVTPEWEHVGTQCPQWLDSLQAAALVHNGIIIGYFGRVSPLMVQRVGGLPESCAYAFSLNGSYLLSPVVPAVRVHALQKYQGSSFDISVLIPRERTVAEIEKSIAAVDPCVVHVRLIDFFEKKEWTMQRSLAFRVEVAHIERTLRKDEIDELRKKVVACVINLGATLRT